jgi:hypothetical protein
VTRRLFFAALVPALQAASVPGLSIRGKLVPGGLELPNHKLIALNGDDATMGVLHDKRLAGSDLEAIGHFVSPDHFEVDPIHLKALFVHKDGKKFQITYWCDVCYIRTYTPGPCWCCQKYTDLDLIEAQEP